MKARASRTWCSLVVGAVGGGGNECRADDYDVKQCTALARTCQGTFLGRSVANGPCIFIHITSTAVLLGARPLTCCFLLANWVIYCPVWATPTANLCTKFEWNRLRDAIRIKHVPQNRVVRDAAIVNSLFRKCWINNFAIEWYTYLQRIWMFA